MTQGNREPGVGWLERVSLLYVYLPCFLFVAGWLRPVIAIPVCGVLAWGLRQAMRSSTLTGEDADAPAPEDPFASPGRPFARAVKYLLIAGIVAIVVAYSGIGGYSAQVSDYALKHNSFLKDFTEYEWPLAYDKTGPKNQPGPLVTYIAFYLPPAAVGKVLGGNVRGWGAANFASAAWAAVGIYLAVLWFLRLVGRFSVAFALLFLFFGGLDILGWLAIYRGPLPPAKDYIIDNWMLYAQGTNPTVGRVMNSVIWCYGSNMAFICEGVHHILPGWIIALMIFHGALHRRSCANTFFLWAAAPLGSVFAALGMIPYLFASVIETRFRRVFTWQNIVAAPLLLLISGLFFLSNRGDYPHGWLWKYQNLTSSWLLLLAFCIVEFGAYVAFCPVHLANPGKRPGRLWWWIAIACLMGLPLYRLGACGDFTSKTAVPSLLLLGIYLAATIANARTHWEKNAVRILILLLILGACPAIHEIARGFSTGLKRPPAWQTVRHVDQLTDPAAAAQLYGDPNAFFWKYLAKPLTYH